MATTLEEAKKIADHTENEIPKLIDAQMLLESNHDTNGGFGTPVENSFENWTGGVPWE